MHRLTRLISLGAVLWDFVVVVVAVRTYVGARPLKAEFVNVV